MQPIVSSFFQLYSGLQRLYLYLTVVIAVFLISCGDESKKSCDFTSTNPELVIYNQIITELVENRMHFFYLRSPIDEVYEKYYYGKDEPDTASIRREFIKIHNRIFKDSTKFVTLYLDTTRRKHFYYDEDSIWKDKEFVNLLREYSEDERAAVDSLNALQTSYLPGDFGFCTFRLAPFRNQATDTFRSIGTLRISKLVLNKAKDKGMFFYDWNCGPLCGHGSIIKFSRIGERWRISGIEYLSIY